MAFIRFFGRGDKEQFLGELLRAAVAAHVVKAKIHYTSFPVSPYNGISPLRLLWRVVSKIPLQRLVANLLRTCWRLRGSYGETCVTDFGHYVLEVNIYIHLLSVRR